MNLVRKEQPKDYFQTETVAREAFWNLYVPGASEHFVVHKMRKHPDFIPELSFVLEADGTVQGGIFYTHSKIVTQKTEIPVVSFGPVFISPAYQRKGLGRKLICHSLQVAKQMGVRAVLTLGYPYHYAPYGFCGAKKYGISMPDGKFRQGLLALELEKNALQNCFGHIVFSGVLETKETDVAEFDKRFPVWEKQVLPCQAEYEKACEMLDE